MNEERGNLIAKALLEDKEQAERLFAMDPEAAAAEFKKVGYDFTPEELIEFGKDVAKAYAAQGPDGELKEESLEDVAGGCGYCAGVGAVVGAGLGLALTVALFW